MRPPRPGAVAPLSQHRRDRVTYVEQGVIVGGYSALLASTGLRDLARKGYFDRVRADRRAELLACIDELERAGRAWQQNAAAEAERNNETRPRETITHSPLSARQAADLLRLTPRRVQQLAESIGGAKHKGRWMFDRAAVLAEAQRRRERDGHQGPIGPCGAG